jgi:hypothetical protein
LNRGVEAINAYLSARKAEDAKPAPALKKRALAH